MEVYRWMGHDASHKCNIVILTNSQVTIKVLHSLATSSKLMEQCWKSSSSGLPTIRTSGGIREADGVSFSTVEGEVYSHYLTATDFRWRLTTRTKSRRIWSFYSKTRSLEFLGQMRPNPYNIIFTVYTVNYFSVFSFQFNYENIILLIVLEVVIFELERNYNLLSLQ